MLINMPQAGLYICKRTSATFTEEWPCDEAFKVLTTVTDTRCVDDPRKIPGNNGTRGDWYTKGSNHRVEGGMIKRDIGTRESWAVEFVDLPALTAFVDKYGECILGRNREGFCTVEIYDSYR